MQDQPTIQTALAAPDALSGSRPRNRYDAMEWAGAFGDIGTLIPFVVAYITILGVAPLGLLFMFGISKIAAGLFYKTPIPIQPMKAIGAAAVAGGITPAALFASGLTTGLFWLVIGLTGTIGYVAKLATKPVVRGIMLGLGMSFIVEGIHRMVGSPVLATIALATTFVLLTNPKIPAMFVLLLIGMVAAVIANPALLGELARFDIGFRLPQFGLHHIRWDDIVTGTLLFTLPQIPLTLGNAVVPSRPRTTSFSGPSGHRAHHVHLPGHHESGFAPVRWGAHVSRRRRHGRPCAVRGPDRRLPGHPRHHSHRDRAFLQPVRGHHLQDVPASHSRRHPVSGRGRTGRDRARHRHQEVGILRHAGGGRVRHVAHGRGLPGRRHPGQCPAAGMDSNLNGRSDF
jgi:hypothetical protein